MDVTVVVAIEFVLLFELFIVLLLAKAVVELTVDIVSVAVAFVASVPSLLDILCISTLTDVSSCVWIGRKKECLVLKSTKSREIL